MLLVDFSYLVGWCFVRDVAAPEDDVPLLLQRSPGHVVGDGVGFPGDVAVGDRLPQGGLGAADIFKRPVDRMALWPLIQTSDEPNHKLAVAKHTDRQIERRPRATKFGQELHSITHGKGLGLVVGTAGAIMTANTDKFLTFTIKDDEATSSNAILSSAIKLDVKGWSRREAGFGWHVKLLS